MTAPLARLQECFGDLSPHQSALLSAPIEGYNMPKTPKGKLILSSIVGFCLLFLIDWSGLTGRSFPRNWGEALIEVCINIGWILFFALVSYFFLIRRRSRSRDDVHSALKLSDQKRAGGPGPMRRQR